MFQNWLWSFLVLIFHLVFKGFLLSVTVNVSVCVTVSQCTCAHYRVLNLIEHILFCDDYLSVCMPLLKKKKKNPQTKYNFRESQKQTRFCWYIFITAFMPIAKAKIVILDKLQSRTCWAGETEKKQNKKKKRWIHMNT